MDKSLAKYIDHTLLKPNAIKKDIDQLIEEAKSYQFYSVCINPYWVSYCYDQLKSTEIKVCTVVGFPLGSSTTKTKTFETNQAIIDGATEIDMVINIGELKAKQYDIVKEDIQQVVKAAGNKALVKVIIETSLLTEEEKIKACELAKEAKAHFVKTSTGFSGGGATAQDIALMRQVVGPNMGVKASGGVRDAKTLKLLLEAGATRIGASSSVDILISG